MTCKQGSHLEFYGESVSPGIAIGNAFLFDNHNVIVNKTCIEQGQEKDYLRQWYRVRDDVYQDLDVIKEKLSDNPQQAAIMDVHQAILMDAAIEELVESSIMEDKTTVDYAVQSAFNQFINLIKQLEDSRIAQREADLRDVRNRIFEKLGYDRSTDLSLLPPGSILVARDLLPSDTATLDSENVAAIVTETGSSTSHSAILAKSLGIPAVLGVQDIVETIAQDTPLIVDAIQGIIIVEPTSEQNKLYQHKMIAYRHKYEAEQAHLLNDAELQDGTRIYMGINIGNIPSQETYRGADFIGLFRTEFLYMERQALPNEDEQFEVYKTILQQSGHRPVTLRTLDIGGDKDLPYLTLPDEANPFLGVRALRFCFDHPQILKTQFSAALRASSYGKLKIMLPMVGSLDDIRRAKVLLDEVIHELDVSGCDRDYNVELGIMIEVPSAAILADKFAKEVDFASIGTNDLCQYLFASDRLNPNMRTYYQMFSPAMLRALKYTIQSFNNANKPISICGEMAGDPKAALVLVGMGMRRLSMNKASLAHVKKALSRFKLEEAEFIAETVLSFGTQAEVLEYLNALNVE